jgi:hypothetical protein
MAQSHICCRVSYHGFTYGFLHLTMNLHCLTRPVYVITPSPEATWEGRRWNSQVTNNTVARMSLKPQCRRILKLRKSCVSSKYSTFHKNPQRVSFSRTNSGHHPWRKSHRTHPDVYFPLPQDECASHEEGRGGQHARAISMFLYSKDITF